MHAVDMQIKVKTGAVRGYLMPAETVEIHDTPSVLTVMVDITDRKHTETELLAAVDAVMRDTSWPGQRIVERMAAVSSPGSEPSAAPEVATLPERLREVPALVAQGLADDDIASRLGITRNTGRNHISAISGRLGSRRRGAVIVWARERGLGAAAKPRITPPKVRKPKRE